MAEREKRKKGFNDYFKIALTRAFMIHDLHAHDPDYIGYGFDPDIVNPTVVGVKEVMKWPEFKRVCYDILKTHPLFIDAGILQMKGEMETGETECMTQETLILNIQTMAREYRENNSKPTQEELADAAAVRANPMADLTQHKSLKEKQEIERRKKERESDKLKFNINYQIPMTLTLANYDLRLRRPDHVGYGMDPDIVGDEEMKWQEFEKTYFRYLLEHPLFIRAGIRNMTAQAFHTNAQKFARVYRECYRKPNQIEIAESAEPNQIEIAESADRNILLRRLEDDKITLQDQLNMNGKLLIKYKDKSKKQKRQIKTRDEEISSLKGKNRELQAPQNELLVLAGKGIIAKNNPEKIFDYLSADKKHEFDVHKFDSTTKQSANILTNTLGALLYTECKPNDILSMCEITKKSIAVPQKDSIQVRADNERLNAISVELTNQLKVVKKELEDATKKNEADLQFTLNEKALCINELTKRLMDSQQENEKLIWDTNELTEKVDTLESVNDTLVMQNISRATEWKSWAAAEKEDRRKSSENHRKSTEAHRKTESKLNDEITTLKRQLAAQEKGRRKSRETSRKSTEEHLETKSKLQNEVTTMKRRLAEEIKLRETEAMEYQVVSETHLSLSRNSSSDDVKVIDQSTCTGDSILLTSTASTSTISVAAAAEPSNTTTVTRLSRNTKRNNNDDNSIINEPVLCWVMAGTSRRSEQVAKITDQNALSLLKKDGNLLSLSENALIKIRYESTGEEVPVPRSKITLQPPGRSRRTRSTK